MSILRDHSTRTRFQIFLVFQPNFTLRKRTCTKSPLAGLEIANNKKTLEWRNCIPFSFFSRFMGVIWSKKVVFYFRCKITFTSAHCPNHLNPTHPPTTRQRNVAIAKVEKELEEGRMPKCWNCEELFFSCHRCWKD